jgi:hypothetical protein
MKKIFLLVSLFVSFTAHGADHESSQVPSEDDIIVAQSYLDWYNTLSDEVAKTIHAEGSPAATQLNRAIGIMMTACPSNSSSTSSPAAAAAAAAASAHTASSAAASASSSAASSSAAASTTNSSASSSSTTAL